MQRIAKPERLLNLVAFLLSARTAVPFSRIKGRVAGYDDDASPEALEKRFDRDKAELRALGVPIVYEPMDEHGHEGYRIPRDQYFLPEIRLSLEEAAALAVLQRYATDAQGGDPLARPLLSALRKFLVDSPLTGAAAASVAEQHVLGVRTERRAATKGTEVSANLSLLTDAVLRHRPVVFRYYAIKRDEILEREVDPFGLGWHKEHWYLVGRDRLREEIRQFRIDRIRGRVKLTKGRFDVPDDFDVAEHVGRPAYLFGGAGEVENVEVEIRPEIVFMLRDALREGSSMREIPGGGAVLGFEASERSGVIRFVAQHAERARILKPEGLRSSARDFFQAIRDAHEGPPDTATSRRRS